eukprot:1827836-Prymnesium_polylepis.1
MSVRTLSECWTLEEARAYAATAARPEASPGLTAVGSLRRAHRPSFPAREEPLVRDGAPLPVSTSRPG